MQETISFPEEAVSEVKCVIVRYYFESRYNMCSVDANPILFGEYRKIVDRYVNTDVREVNFQNRVVLNLLDRVLINENTISVVDVSTQYKNRESKNYHTRKYYAGEHTPDLLVVKKWNYKNIKMEKEDYVALVEVKSPALDPISRNRSHTIDEVNEYLEINNKVILTDCYEWRFYEKGKDTKTFVLHDKNEWVMESDKKTNCSVTEIGFTEKREESIVWNDLLSYLKEFVIVR